MVETKQIVKARIIKKTVRENEDVYDLTVRKNHNFFANGLLVHNCAEISLRPFQFCNLTTINAGNVVDQDDLNARARAAAFIGTLQASYTNFHYLRDIWKRTTEREALIGVSMTGIAAGAVLNLDLKLAANVVKEENARVAELIGINRASRCTTVKPEGTSSLVLGTSSGIHSWHNDYYIRRIRVGKNESIYSYLLFNHPELLEDDFFKPNIQAVISIPQRAPEGAITRQESALDLLGRVSKVWKEWVKTGHRKGENKNNVSVTVSIKDGEWEDVGEWMWANKENFTALSVLPFDGGSYVQAPFTDCTKEEYEALVNKLHAIDLTQVVEIEDMTNLSGEIACGGGQLGCEVV
jgi:ribonucleoside-triphosphate reductase